MGSIRNYKGVDPPLLAFRVFPSTTSKLFLYVRLFASNAAMYRYEKQTYWFGTRPTKDYDALCRTYFKSNPNGRLSPELGEILLTTRNLWPNAVAHECTHGMFAFMRRKRLRMPDRLNKSKGMSNPDEEIVCHAVGDMTDQIYRKLIKHGYEF